jgi:hypothetical protein
MPCPRPGRIPPPGRATAGRGAGKSTLIKCPLCEAPSHRDRLAALREGTEPPAEKAAICRLLGYGGRAGDAALLRPLLDDGDAQVREGAAIGLGLLRDPESTPRLDEFRKR